MGDHAVCLVEALYIRLPGIPVIAADHAAEIYIEILAEDFPGAMVSLERMRQICFNPLQDLLDLLKTEALRLVSTLMEFEQGRVR